jgi:hypothetical protein
MIPRTFFLTSLLLLAPSIALAAPKTFQELVNLLVILMNNAVIVLIVLGLVVYFYGVSTNILHFQEGASSSWEKIKAYFFWGIIVLFVMVSIWGILQLLQNTLFGGDKFTTGGARPPVDSGSFTAPLTFE